MDTLRAPLSAALYDAFMGPAERLFLGEVRRALLAGCRGDGLEIGAGTGANLPYLEASSRLVLCEPHPGMRARLAVRVRRAGQAGLEIRGDEAECLDVPDASFDFVVATFVLCSVAGLRPALQEVRRVLGPSGQFYFIEHVGADDGWRRALLEGLTPFWARLAGNCHLDRPTVDDMRACGLEVEVRERRVVAGILPVVVGVARPVQKLTTC